MGIEGAFRFELIGDLSYKGFKLFHNTILGESSKPPHFGPLYLGLTPQPDSNQHLCAFPGGSVCLRIHGHQNPFDQQLFGLSELDGAVRSKDFPQRGPGQALELTQDVHVGTGYLPTARPTAPLQNGHRILPFAEGNGARRQDT